MEKVRITTAKSLPVKSTHRSRKRVSSKQSAFAAISELIFENEKIYFEKIGISAHLSEVEKPLNIV